MIYTKHLTLTDTTLQEVFAVPDGYVCSVSYIFVANHGGATNQVDLYWDAVGDSESTIPSPGTTTLNYTFTSPATDVYLEVRKNGTVLDNPTDYSVDLGTKTVTLVAATVSGEEYTISRLDPEVYVFDSTSINGSAKETLGGQSSLGIFALHEGETVKTQTSGAGNVEVAVTFELLEKPAVLVDFNGS